MNKQSTYLLVMMAGCLIAIYVFDMPKTPVGLFAAAWYGFASIAIELEDIKNKLHLVLDNQSRQAQKPRYDDDY